MTPLEATESKWTMSPEKKNGSATSQESDDLFERQNLPQTRPGSSPFYLKLSHSLPTPARSVKSAHSYDLEDNSEVENVDRTLARLWRGGRLVGVMGKKPSKTKLVFLKESSSN